MEAVRKAVKERILKDIVGGVQDGTGGGWRVLILDDFTTRVLSSAVKMSDILDCNISVVEDLSKKRQPLSQAAIYFIQPTATSIAQLCADFTRSPLYPSVHVFLSSKLPAEALENIKATEPLLRVLKTLKEGNLEFLTIDSRTVVTDHPSALVTMMGERCESDRGVVMREVDVISTRLTTLFATLGEFPVVRYKVGRAPEPGDPPGQAMRSQLPQLLAARLIEKLSVMQRGGQLPARETCDMLVLDRSYDAVSPFIHEWSYEAMTYDLVQMDGKVYRYTPDASTAGEGASGGGQKEALLDEASDEVWRDLRHAFIAEVYTSLGSRFKEFAAKNKAAKLGGSTKGEMSTSNIRSLITALPQYREVLSRLSVHVQVSQELKQVTNERSLTDVGELEQDLVLGEKNSKDLINFLQDNPQLQPMDKMRLMLCYLATHPGKLDATKKAQWAKLAGLGAQDMAAVCNLAYLGVKVMEAQQEKSGFFGRGKSKVPTATRRKRDDDGEEQYALNRFHPLLLDLLEDLVAGRLTQDDFPYIRPPSTNPDDAPAASARTARSGLNWARRNQAADGAPAGGGSGARRLVVFVLGGVTHSEMRVAHRVAAQTGRDVVLASTSVETPTGFTHMLYEVSVV